jgi:hypothetical protein
MITSVFSKSNPANFLMVAFVVLIAFVVNESRLALSHQISFSFLNSFLKIITLIFSLFLVNFVSKRNNLTKDNTFGFLYFGMFLIFIPQSLENVQVILANFFVLLSIRKVLSLKSLTAVKEKIFDASLWIFVASLFHFWSLLFILVVFVAILLHAASDYRNWFLPIIGFFTVFVLFSAYCMLTHTSLIDYFTNRAQFDFSFKYFDSKIESAQLVLYLLVSIAFIVVYFFGIGKKPTSAQSNIFKVIFIWIIGLIIFAISPQKTNALLLFTFLSTSVFASEFLESTFSNWFKEFVTWVFSIATIVVFVYS